MAGQVTSSDKIFWKMLVIQPFLVALRIIGFLFFLERRKICGRQKHNSFFIFTCFSRTRYVDIKIDYFFDVVRLLFVKTTTLAQAASNETTVLSYINGIDGRQSTLMDY